MHTLHSLLALAVVNTLVSAQRCNEGLTLIQDDRAAYSCCVKPGTVPGAACNTVNFNPTKTICYWPRAAEEVSFTYIVPPDIRTAAAMRLKGTYGERLTSTPHDPARQRGGYIITYPLAIGERNLTIYPGSFYGGIDGGMPPVGERGARGVTWARGGAATAIFGSYVLIAAGGGGQGAVNGIGTDADYDGDYSPGLYAGGAASSGNGWGGGGAGLGGSRAPSRGGISGSHGDAYAAWFRAGYNTDNSPTAWLVMIEFLCGETIPVTTVTEPAPAATQYITDLNIALETSTLPSPTQLATVTVESARPPEYVDSTVTPDASYSTRTDTTKTYPPESTDYSTFTPETSFFTESPSVETTPATSTVYETYTPPTSYFTQTVPGLFTPATVTSTLTSTPPTRVIPTTITELRTTSKGTSTVIISSATGNANCVHLRMVYPAACCPNTYIKSLKPWTSGATSRQRRNVHFARDLTTVFTPSGTTTVTISTTSTSTALITPDPVLVTETETTPGPITTITNLFTAEAETLIVDETATVEGPAPTRTITVTADAPSYTITETQYYAAPTPLYTDVSTAAAPSSFATETSYSTLPAPVSIAREEAPTPLTTSTSVVTQYQTVPVATRTTTAYSRATTCALKTALTLKCPIPILRTADQIVQLALIKTNKFLSGNRPVQIDCGTAGLWSFV
ncbi:hypothetical protein JCM10449v2_006092 [Rhodotorula kratochvilovae]